MKAKRLRFFLWGTGVCAALYGAAHAMDLVDRIRSGDGGMQGLFAGFIQKLTPPQAQLPRYSGDELVVGGRGLADLGVPIEDAAHAATGVRALFPTESAQAAKAVAREIVMQDVRNTALDAETESSLEKSAVALHTAGRLDEAISAYWEAIKATPKDAGLHLNLGIAYMQKGYLDKARAQVNEADRLGARIPSQLASALGWTSTSGAGANPSLR